MLQSGWKLVALFSAGACLLLALAWNCESSDQTEEIARLREALQDSHADEAFGVMHLGELGLEAQDSQVRLVKADIGQREMSREIEWLEQTRDQLKKTADTAQATLETKSKIFKERLSAAQAAKKAADEQRRRANKAKARAEVALGIAAASKGRFLREAESLRVLAGEATKKVQSAESRAADVAKSMETLRQETKIGRQRILSNRRTETAVMNRRIDELVQKSEELRRDLEMAKQSRLDLSEKLEREVALSAQAKRLNVEYRKVNREEYNAKLALEEQLKKVESDSDKRIQTLEDQKAKLTAKASRLEKQLQELIEDKENLETNVRSFERSSFQKLKEFPKLKARIRELERTLEEQPASLKNGPAGDLERRAIAAETNARRTLRKLKQAENDRDAIERQRRKDSRALDAAQKTIKELERRLRND